MRVPGRSGPRASQHQRLEALLNQIYAPRGDVLRRHILLLSQVKSNAIVPVFAHGEARNCHTHSILSSPPLGCISLIKIAACL